MRFCAPLASLLSLVLTACVQTESEPFDIEKKYARELPPGALALEQVRDPAEYPAFYNDDREKRGLQESVRRSLSYLRKPSSKKYYPFQGISHERAQRTLEAFLHDLETTRTPRELDRRIRDRYDVYRSVGWDGQGTVLFTGYYEPIFEASAQRQGRFRYPVYALPEDLVKDSEGRCLGRRLPDGSLVPYYTREEITSGALAGRGLEIAWLEDPFEAYTAAIQGSVRLRMRDGSLLKLGYAGKNDRPYASVGGALLDGGKISKSELSLKGLKSYFAAHPAELSVLNVNESYVFFQERDGGPVGSLNVEVTPYRTLATDKSVFPRGGLSFVATEIPASGRSLALRGGADGFEPFEAFVLDQDTGGAIRSAGRADIFVGTGPAAERVAGRILCEGQLYYLFLKNDAMSVPTSLP